uniref:Mediator of RNA polymerase II transcription subunit 28 n=1 Tax=Timema shepardi TaxID=629360 RepID=A0A7R9AP56_TIMSH|nr:unnamed protein product [Timema shepardi]
MATTANGNGNLVDEFEEAFQSCLNVLTKEEALSTMEKDEIRVEVDHTILRFIDLARQMEAFFLQKRFLLSALKPELVVKEDTNELRLELVRKEELIKRHYEKIAVALECQWLRVVGVPLAPWSLLSRPCSSSSRQLEVLAGLPSLHKALVGYCRDPWPTWRRQRATLGCRRVAGDAGVGGGGVEAGGELAAVDVPHWSTGLPPENPSHFPLV